MAKQFEDPVCTPVYAKMKVRFGLEVEEIECGEIHVKSHGVI